MTRNKTRETLFKFKKFSVANAASAMKVGTDGVMLGAWGGDGSPDNILDIGTGTGLIALMTAQRFPGARITAIEIDPAASQEAAANFSNSLWADRLEVVNADFRKWASETDMRFDLIISNPPFFTNGIRSDDTVRATARHSDSLGPSDIVNLSPSLLSTSGKLAMVIPSAISEDIIYEAAIARLFLSRQCNVKSSAGKAVSRTLLEFTTADRPILKSNMTIRDGDGFSDEYRRLTSDFYLQF